MARNANRRRIWPLLTAFAVAAPAAGCADLYFDRRETVSLHAGDSVASNKAAQMIDPWPASASDRNIPGDGTRMQRAYERYRTNKTTPLATTATSSTPFVPMMGPANNGGGGGVGTQ